MSAAETSAGERNVPAGGRVVLRAARPGDAQAIARLILMAGGGVYEFLLDGLFGGLDAVTLMMPGITGDSGPHSHRQCIVAEVPGAVIGIAHAYPAAWMQPGDPSVLPADRLAHLAAFDTTQDKSSYFLSALAVAPSHRRRGLAGRLLALTEQRARDAGFNRVTLHVWADNAPARALYARHGFTEIATAAIPWHPRLPHEGGSVLMGKG
jgi:GNAT superfamily N-acetyltransferase